MAKGRGSAVLGSVMMVCLLLLIQFSHMPLAADYTVGDDRGWTFNVDTWPNGKNFRAGDTLVFNYENTAHNVVSVTEAGYSGCTTPSGSVVHVTGKDRIQLMKGPNYFICNFPGHCQSGMKIAVNAL